MIIFQTSLKNTIIAVIITYAMQVFFQIIALCGVLFIWPDFDINTSFSLTLLIILAYVLLTILAIHFFPLRALYEKASKASHFVVLSCIFVYIILSLVCFFLQHIDISPIFLLIVSLLFICMLFMTLCIYFFRVQKKEQAVSYYENYLSVLDDMILAIRKTQHNHNNTIQAIAGLSETYSDYDSLAAALENYSLQAAKNTIPAQLLHFENKLLTALLYNKFCLAQEYGIIMDITVHDYFYASRLNEFQIVELTGILLDNAIEAVTGNNDIFDNTSEAVAADNTIIVEIGAPVLQKEETAKNTEAPFNITVKNPGPEASPEFIKQIFTDGYTSKTTDTEKHGLGLAHVKTLTKRHKGHIEIGNEMLFSNTSQNECRYFVICVSI